MRRNVAILGAAMAVLALTYPPGMGAQAAQAGARDARHKAVAAVHVATTYGRSNARQMVRIAVRRASTAPAEQFAAPEVETIYGAPTSLAYQAGPATIAPAPGQDAAALAGDIAPMPSKPPVLSQQEREAGRLANAQGDKTFVMVNKALGKIILFENGQPVFAAPALTGQSTADELPQSDLGQKFDSLNAPSTKITPAGRYTVLRGFDPELGGPLFDIHEIRGKDWGIAIHQLYLGIPSEHREVRILSPNEQDKHITYGCINVTSATLHLLMQELPATGPIALYILPEDPSRTAAYFTPRTSS